MNYYKIINVSPIIFCPERIFHSLIKRIKIDIREELACKIAYRQSFASSSVKQTFIQRQSLISASVSLKLIVFRRVVIDDLIYQRQQPVYIYGRITICKIF